MPIVSICMTACNGSAYIGEQIESLLNQTRIPDEILIGDDSPDDAVEQAIAPFLPRHPNIRYSRNMPALGINANFIRQIQEANGDFIFLCDQDDVWLPHKIETYMDCFAAHPEVEIIASNSQIGDENANPTKETLNDVFHLTSSDTAQLNGQNPLQVILHRHLYLYGHTVAFRARLKPFFNDFPPTPYYDAIFTLFAGCHGHLHYLINPTDIFRRHGANASSLRKKENIFQKIIRLSAISQKKNPFVPSVELYSQTLAFLRANDAFHFPEEKMQMLQDAADYYMGRARVFELPRLLKCFGAYKVRGYFRFGHGLKTLARDLFL